MGTPCRRGKRLRRTAACAAFAVLGWLGMPSAAASTNQQDVLLFLSAAREPRQGFVRIINHSDQAGEVRIEAIDDDGVHHGPLTLFVGAANTVHFNSKDLEAGNPSKGLPEGTGAGKGDWRLELSSELHIEALAYIRTGDGMLASMHDAVRPFDGIEHYVPTFNPGSNYNQESQLRLVNLSDEAATVWIYGTDDAGVPAEETVWLTLSAHASRTFTAAQLESGAAPGLQESLGDGQGKWRLHVESDQEIAVMSLLSSPTGHLTNLSTLPDNALGVQTSEGGFWEKTVPLFPAASNAAGRQGFVRLKSPHARIEAIDDAGRAYKSLTLDLDPEEAGRTTHFNSTDLEAGNPKKGLSGSTGPGEGDWWLKVRTSYEDELALAYIRTPKDGFLTAMHDTAPGVGTRYRVATFNPGSNYRQVSLLRLVNPQDEVATVAIQGIDDSGAPGDQAVWLRVPARSARTIESKTLESGGSGLLGALGDGIGKWQLIVNSDRSLSVMSLLQSPTGHLMNISTAPVRGAAGLPPPPASTGQWAAGFFRDKVSGPVVQSRCVACHAQGGAAGSTRLVFVGDGNQDHETANLQALGTYLDEVEHGSDSILDKVRGLDHDGGHQITPGSEDFVNLEELLLLLGGPG